VLKLLTLIILIISVMDYDLKRKYCNITRQTIEVYLLVCQQCQFKKEG